MKKVRTFLLLYFASILVCGSGTIYAGTKNVLISSQGGWQNTGIYVQQGDWLCFTPMAPLTEQGFEWSSGRWTGGFGGTGYPISTTLVPTVSAYSVVGKIGNSAFNIGGDIKDIDSAPDTGYLFIAMNDTPGEFGDNSGDVLMIISHYHYEENGGDQHHEETTSVCKYTHRSNPITRQSLRTFKRVVFAERIVPRAVDEEMRADEGEEGEKRPYLKRHEASADLEYETFKLNKAEGNNFTVRAGLGRSNADCNTFYGFNVFVNNLSFDNLDDSFNNSYVNVYYKGYIRETDTGTVSLGVTFDYMFLDADYCDDDGYGIGTMIAGKQMLNNSMLSWGVMYQGSMVGDYSEGLVNGGLMLGVPIGERFAFTVDCFGIYTAIMEYDGEEIDIDDPFMLNTGLYFDIYVSSIFAINAGMKKVFLVEDYTSDEIVIGAGYRF